MKSGSLSQQHFEHVMTLVARGENLTNNLCRGLFHGKSTFSFLSSHIKCMQKIDDLNCKVGKYTQSY